MCRKDRSLFFISKKAKNSFTVLDALLVKKEIRIALDFSRPCQRLSTNKHKYVVDLTNISLSVLLFMLQGATSSTWN